MVSAVGPATASVTVVTVLAAFFGFGPSSLPLSFRKETPEPIVPHQAATIAPGRVVFQRKPNVSEPLPTHPLRDQSSPLDWLSAEAITCPADGVEALAAHVRATSQDPLESDIWLHGYSFAWQSELQEVQGAGNHASNTWTISLLVQVLVADVLFMTVCGLWWWRRQPKIRKTSDDPQTVAHDGPVVTDGECGGQRSEAVVAHDECGDPRDEPGAAHDKPGGEPRLRTIAAIGVEHQGTSPGAKSPSLSGASSPSLSTAAKRRLHAAGLLHEAVAQETEKQAELAADETSAQDTDGPCAQDAGNTQRRRDADDLLTLMRQRRADCEEFQSAPDDSTADAGAAASDGLKMASVAQPAAPGDVKKTKRDVRAWMAQLRSDSLDLGEKEQQFIATDAKAATEDGQKNAAVADPALSPRRANEKKKDFHAWMAQQKDRCEELSETVQTFVSTDAKCEPDSMTTPSEALPNSSRLSFDGGRRRCRSEQEVRELMMRRHNQCTVLGNREQSPQVDAKEQGEMNGNRTPAARGSTPSKCNEKAEKEERGGDEVDSSSRPRSTTGSAIAQAPRQSLDGARRRCRSDQEVRELMMKRQNQCTVLGQHGESSKVPEPHTTREVPEVHEEVQTEATSDEGKAACEPAPVALQVPEAVQAETTFSEGNAVCEPALVTPQVREDAQETTTDEGKAVCEPAPVALQVRQEAQADTTIDDGKVVCEPPPVAPQAGEEAQAETILDEGKAVCEPAPEAVQQPDVAFETVEQREAEEKQPNEPVQHGGLAIDIDAQEMRPAIDEECHRTPPAKERSCGRCGETGEKEDEKDEDRNDDDELLAKYLPAVEVPGSAEEASANDDRLLQYLPPLEK